MNTKKTEQATTFAGKTTFADILRNYEQLASEYRAYNNPYNPYNPKNKPAGYFPHTNKMGKMITLEKATELWNRHKANSETEYTIALQTLATACTYSVLKKLANVGGAVTESTKATTDTAKTIRELRRTLTADLNTLDRLKYATDNATEYRYNADGDTERVILDRNLYEDSKKLASQSLSGEGLDLVNTAIMVILAETEKVADLDTNFMEAPYTVRRLKKKVYIQNVDSLGGYETVNTTPIQEVYKAIRREISANRSMQIANNKYTYIADTLTDTETDTTETVYRRLPKYSGLAYESEKADIYGYRQTITTPTAPTADIETATQIDTLIEKMNLTTKQAQILKYRLSGYGYKAIATFMGIRADNVSSQVKEMRRKAIAKGITPQTATADTKTE